MTVYVYASVCDFVCIALLLPFVLGFCLFIYFYYNFFFFWWWCCFTKKYGSNHVIRMRREQDYSKKWMHPNVHCSTIYNSQDMEAT